MLKVRDLVVRYDSLQVLWGTSLEVREKEFVCLLGPNGAGKSTIVNAISGLVDVTAGEIWFRGERIDSLPVHARIRRGLSHVLERRRVFPDMTVVENLEMGAYSVPELTADSLRKVNALFPRLAQRPRQLAKTLSGGEQQMLAIARGLMSAPKFLILDEPLLGLAPEMVTKVGDTLKAINASGVTILFVEQNVEMALSIASRGYILEAGKLVLQGSAEELLEDERVREVYLGIS